MAIEAGDRTRIGAAKKGARRLLRIAGKIAKERVETFHLAGRLAWARGRRRQAAKWWARGIAEGERQGAMPELARVHLVVGQLLGGAEAGRHQRRGREILDRIGLGGEAGAPPAAVAAYAGA
jgi:hypothetical protein